MTALAIAPKLERFFVRGAISARATLPLVRDSWSGVLAITIDASLMPARSAQIWPSRLACERTYASPI